jgi:acyltransferase-like protein
MLSLLGWRPPSDSIIEKMRNNSLIIVITHTSIWDFVLFLLYKLMYQEFGSKWTIVMKPQPFKYWGWFLRPIGCIPATRSEDKGHGFVHKTIKGYQNKDFQLVISPKGKMLKSEWRSGYYHLRRGLKANIVVAGLDYERKSLQMGPIHSDADIKDLNETDLGDLLKTDMGSIVPLYPECSNVQITREYDPGRIGVVNWGFLILVVLIIVILCVVIYLLLIQNRHPGVRSNQTP